jgi:beta-glucosidase/6-phospho-beta-glucosidase/beta-galactosidase
LHPLPDDNDENLPIGKGLKGLTADGEELAVAAFHNVPNPEQRLKFWSEPDTELQLAAGANVSVFRMGIDWGRIVPDEPAEGTAQVVRGLLPWE